MKETSCPYCNIKLPPTFLPDHIGYEHSEKLRATKKRIKIAMPIIIIGISVVIGMLWMELIK